MNALFPLLLLAILAVVFAVKANAGLLDRVVYTRDLESISGHTLTEAFRLRLPTKREPFYILFMWIISGYAQTAAWFYLCVGIACSVIFLIAMLWLAPWWQVPLIWLTTLALGTFTAYASLVARQGLSMAFMFAAVCLILGAARSRWWIMLLVASALMHWSAIPVALAVALVTFARVRLRVAVALWGAAATLFLTGVQERALGPVAAMLPGMSHYTDPGLSAVYRGGVNRLDFFLFSLGILAVGLLAVRRGAPTPWYPQLVVLYCTLNVYFLIFGFIEYSDRIAAYSWTLAPLVVAIPFANPRSTMGRLATVGFLSAIMAYGFLMGPFLQMTGIKSY